MAFADKYRKGNAVSFGSQYRKDSMGASPIKRQPIVQKRTPIQETDRYKQAVSNADKAAEEARYASSFKGMASNALKAAPQAARDVLVGTPAKFVASTAEIPGIVARNGQTTQRSYKVPGLSPFKSFQSDFANVADDVIEGKSGLGRAAWELAKVPLAGVETLGIAKGLGRGVTALRGGDVKGAAINTIDAFLPTTRGAQKLNVSELPESTGKTLSTPRKLITSGGRVLRESGEGGIQAERLFRQQKLDKDLMVGKYNKFLNDTFSDLNKAEKENVTDLLEGVGKPISEKAQKAFEKMRPFYKTFAEEAQKREFTIRTPDGKEVPFKAREDYSPRIYNWDEITKADRKERILQEMVDKGTARNKAEAKKMFEDFISANAERRAGNLENPRLYDIPGYEKDAEVAARIYADRAAERFTQADLFGKKDEVVAELINKIADEGGDYEEAQKVFDYLYKGLPNSKVASALTQYNLATKLDLGAITNISQTINTATKAGIANTTKAILKGFTKEGDDLATLANVYDDMVATQETGVTLNKFVKGVMWLFGKVERFNRRTAAVAGKLRAEELAAKIAQNPDAVYAVRQLKSLGIDPAKLVNGKLTGEDVLTAANKMSELTQFKPNVLNTPRIWKTPLGRVLTQFKSFAFMQTRFITDEIAKEAAKGNVAPLLRFLTLAPIFSYVTYSVRNAVTGREPKDERLALDVRTLDKYFKSAGSFYTEPIVQGKYLRDLYNNEYASNIEKVLKPTLGTFGGPTGGEVTNLITGLENAKDTRDSNKMFNQDKDPYRELKRQAVGSLPFFGEYAKNKGLPYELSNTRIKKDTIKELLQTGTLSETGQVEEPGFFQKVFGGGDNRTALDRIADVYSDDRTIQQIVKGGLEQMAKSKDFIEASDEERLDMVGDLLKKIHLYEGKVKKGEKSESYLEKLESIKTKPYYQP